MKGCLLWGVIIVVGSIAAMAIVGSLLPTPKPSPIAARRFDRTIRAPKPIATDTPVVDFCTEAMALETRSIVAMKAGRWAAGYTLVQKGLIAERSCGSPTRSMIGKGYLLSMRAFAEHRLPYGDSQTDLNQAEQLLEECQTTPGIYGTHRAAECESQEQDDIRAQTNWETGQ